MGTDLAGSGAAGVNKGAVVLNFSVQCFLQFWGMFSSKRKAYLLSQFHKQTEESHALFIISGL